MAADEAKPFDDATRRRAESIPMLTIRAGPRDGEQWKDRLREEYTALIQYIQSNKDNDMDWFTIQSNEIGNRWNGKCWYYHNQLRYEFDFEFEIPAAYPSAPPEIKIPELDGKTAKMYRFYDYFIRITLSGGIICTTDHFNPLWQRNIPHFGIAIAMALGLAPWLASEIPHLVDTGVIIHEG